MFKPKILFLSLYNDEAYGLRLLHSIVHKAGYKASMLFFKINSKAVNQDEINNVSEKEMVLFVEYLKEFLPDVIAVSLVSSNFTIYKYLFKIMKTTLPVCKIIVGGWQGTLNPESTIEYADIVCRGEGEETILEILNSFEIGRGPENIANVCFKKLNSIICNPVRPLLKDLKNLPILIFDDTSTTFIENNVLIRKDPYRDNDRYGTIIGRGCPFFCTYCSNSFLIKHIYGQDWCRTRYRDTDNVLEELQTVKKELPKVKRINFYDEVFTVKNIDFFQQYKQKINLPFYCMFYPGSCDETMAKLLKEAGLVGVWVGIQSASEYIRRKIFKRFYSLDVIMTQARIFKKYGINVRYDFILDNPFENRAHQIEFIKLLRQLPKPYSVNLFSLKYFPNTEITEMALEEGYITTKKLDDQLNTPHHNYLIHKTRREQLQKILMDKGITII